MVRRTKEDAEATRGKLLDAAQQVFYTKGVAGASLLDIAQAANLTRGAIYWHFQNKSDLFHAMLQRVTFPFEQALHLSEEACAREGNAAKAIVASVRFVLHTVSTDATARQVLDIALHKTECVGEMFAIRERRMQGALNFTCQMERMLQLAALQQQVSLSIPVSSAAHALHAVFCGVLHAWLLHLEPPFDLEEEGVRAISLYLQALGLCADK